jgi:hypothetical protein
MISRLSDKALMQDKRELHAHGAIAKWVVTTSGAVWEKLTVRVTCREESPDPTSFWPELRSFHKQGFTQRTDAPLVHVRMYVECSGQVTH